MSSGRFGILGRVAMSAKAGCRGPIARREFLKIGVLGLGGLSLADRLRLQAQAGVNSSSTNDTAVIFVWLPGGPPHLDMYDMKPLAPSDYRGEFRPISDR